MAWSIAEVARMAHTTSRTLRHYHAIGLLEPAFTGDNGYRYYEREQLLRLQRILLLRELGIDLATVQRILAGQQDVAAALRLHQTQIQHERRRLARLERTVARTLAQVEGEADMPAEAYFDGLNEKQKAYEQELFDRYGDDVKPRIAGARAKLAGWTKDDFDAAMATWRDDLVGLSELRARGLEPASAEVQRAIVGHHEWLTQFWTPNAASYAGLGEMYASDPRFSEQIDAVAPGLADYLREAMTVYAETSLPKA
jgi:DNA-binding transcriptional MerR regulator